MVVLVMEFPAQKKNKTIIGGMTKICDQANNTMKRNVHFLIYLWFTYWYHINVIVFLKGVINFGNHLVSKTFILD